MKPSAQRKFMKLTIIFILLGGRRSVEARAQTSVGGLRGQHDYNLAPNLHERRAVVAHDTVFERVGQLYPHESNLLLKTTLSYAALEAVPQKTQDIADMMEQLSKNLTNIKIGPRPKPPIQERYKVLDGNLKLNIRQARLRCEQEGLRLLSPTDVAELREAGSYFIKNYPATERTRIWIDCKFDIASSQWINKINREPLAKIYVGMRTTAHKQLSTAAQNNPNSAEWIRLWRLIGDDHTTTFGLNPISGTIWLSKVSGLGNSIDGESWYYVSPNVKEPYANFICQSFNLDRNYYTNRDADTSDRLRYTQENLRLPRQEIRETQQIFSAMAEDQRQIINNIIEKYQLHQPLFDDTPEEQKIQGTNVHMINIKRTTTKEVSRITTSEQRKMRVTRTVHAGNHSGETIHNRDSRQKRDILESLAFNVAKSIPIIGPYVGTVQDVLREKKFNNSFTNASELKG